MVVKRLVAKKARVCDVMNGKFFYGSKEELKPSYVITPFGEIVSRTNIFGTVIGKFKNEEGTYETITVDDGTGAISFRVFKDGMGMLDGIDVGDAAVVVGKVKEYNGERYVSGEIARKIADRNYENYRRLELLKRLVPQKKMADDLRKVARTASQEELMGYAHDRYGISEEVVNAILEGARLEVDYKSKVLELIGALDNGDGVDAPKIFEMSKLPENVIESAISELMEEGSLYEPVVGKLKRV